MNEPGAAKKFFISGGAKPTFVLRLIGVIVTAIAIIMAFVSGASNLGSNMLGLPSGAGVAAVGIVIIIYLPVFVLIGMGILWAAALGGASAYEADGSVMRSSAAASMALSAIAFVGGLGFTLLLIGSLSMGGRSSGISFTGNNALGIITLILTAIGVLCLLPTAIGRVLFYRNVQKSMNSDALMTGGATFYAVMKLINVVVKAGFAVVVLISMIQTRGVPATGVIFFISTMLALLVGAVANVMEAIMAFRYRKAAGANGGYYQAPAPAYQSPYYQPEANPYTAADYSNEYTVPASEPVQSQPQSAVTYCPTCGTPNQAGSVFCESCGTRL